MSRFFVLHECFSPNAASSVRLVGLLKALSKRGIDTHVCFFIADENYSKAPVLPNIQYEYYWKRSLFNNQKIQIIKYLFIYIHRFCARIRPNDIVYLYRCDDLVIHLVKKKGIQVYQERTEHPDISHFQLTRVRRYLYSCKKLSGIFVISQQLKQFYINEKVNESKIHVVNMTVDCSRFDGLKKTEGKEDYIAYCGSKMFYKDGLDLLLQSFSKVVSKFRDLKLYVIGNIADEQIKKVITPMTDSLGITNNVVFTGVIPAQKLPQVLKDARLLVLERPDNKQARYGFPTKLGEYLLTENPVVVTSVGDIPLFLEDGISAYLVEPGNPKRFAEKIVYALEASQESLRIGEKGREVAIKSFNSDIEAAKIIKVIFGK